MSSGRIPELRWRASGALPAVGLSSLAIRCPRSGHMGTLKELRGWGGFGRLGNIGRGCCVEVREHSGRIPELRRRASGALPDGNLSSLAIRCPRSGHESTLKELRGWRGFGRVL